MYTGSQIANIIDAIGTGDFYPSLLDWIERSESHLCSFVALHKPNLQPPDILSNVDRYQCAKALRAYQDCTFRINPFYWHQMGCNASGITRAAVLPKYTSEFLTMVADSGVPIIPDASEVIGYYTSGWPRGLDELSIYLQAGSRGTIHIALFRDTVFDDTESRGIWRIRRWLPVIHAAVRNHIIHVGEPPEQNKPASIALPLTRTQLEIFRWWAAGKTLQDIAIIVGIKKRTVRYHMEQVRNYYGYSTVQQTGVRVALDYGLDPMGNASTRMESAEVGQMSFRKGHAETTR